LPTTPGTQPITISTAPNIPQLPWTPAVLAAEEPRSSHSVNAEAVEPAPPPKRSHAKGKPHGRAHRH
jgi:hypothetical protein